MFDRRDIPPVIPAKAGIQSTLPRAGRQQLNAMAATDGNRNATHGNTTHV